MHSSCEDMMCLLALGSKYVLIKVYMVWHGMWIEKDNNGMSLLLPLLAFIQEAGEGCRPLKT
jgi:hypothetical protein